jgi:hypothetical protein
VEFTFHFADSIQQIDFMLYHPRKDGGGNGHILEGSVFVRTAGESEYSKHADFSFANNASSKRITFVGGFSYPKSIRLVVTRGNNDYVSASQFEFFRMNPQAVSYGKYFTDLSLSELKVHVTRQHLHEIHNIFIRQMALDIFDGTYEEARVGSFQTYPDPSIASAMNKTNHRLLRSSAIWRPAQRRHVAAFEVYHNEQLIFATAAHAFTMAQLPVGVELFALGVKGERLAVPLL